MAIADLLAKLVELKNQLVSNLQSMGVAADENEKLNTLVPKIMDIETGVDTSDATATAADILKGKTAYVNDVKVSGTLVQNVEAEFDTSTGAITSMHIGIPNSVEAIGNSAYQNTIRITSITIPDSVTSIGDLAFGNCSNLVSITIPDSVTSIGSFAFQICTSLASITIPGSVTSIEKRTFTGCTSLASVTIGNGVTSIGDYAFYNCISLANIYYTGTQSQWNAITKDASWNANMGTSVSGGTVIHYNYVPE